ncbi:MAG: DegT/DnrJ/EryC1/StrS family aminotransferase [Lentisphaerae bacterium]|nr:DegT/DnrJ/EryC1/StrS family aminotransferase [Lentisphaerota bacterium]
MNVPLLDLKAQHASIADEINLAVADVFASQVFIGGPHVLACEKAVAAYSACAHAIGVSSGTDALLVALMAENIGPGDEVITSPYTFFATGGCVARVGATPVFVDIDPDTFNLNPELVAARITSKTRALMPVHLYGQMADMDPLLALAQKHNLVLIEDAAQAIGAEYKGRRAGSIGHYGCFSFFPSKNLGGAGDGGMVVTQDPARAERVAMLRNHGAHPKYYHRFIGGNFRLDALQAAVVTVKLKHLDAWTAARQANARRYDRLFADASLPERGIVLPRVQRDRHIFNQYVIRTPRRDALREFLNQRHIGNEVYYPVPLHRQECFAYLGYQPGSCPESERAAAESLALPIYPEVSDAQARTVVDAIRDFCTAAH